MRSFWLVVLIICLVQLNVLGREVKYKYNYNDVERVVKKSERTSIVETELGSVSTVDISDGSGVDEYHIEFIVLENNALFLPVLLHAHVLFYVHSGSGTLSWTDGEKSEKMDKISLQRGDLYPLRAGAVFYINSNSTDPDISRLSITAVFTNPNDEQFSGPFVGPYTRITELVRGFDKPVLQAAFQVPDEVIEELTNGADTAAIVRADQQQGDQGIWEEEMLIDVIFGNLRFNNRADENKKKKKEKKKKHTAKIFNFFEEAPDFENCYGSSKVVTEHDLKALRDSQIGVYMVNLTKGSMMGPHWNPSATEVSVVLEGEGMIQVICPSSLTNRDCKNTKVRVEEGDVFTSPRYHPTAEVSFNSGSLVFLGFSTTPSKKNRLQLLAGKGSVLQTLDERILSVSFNVSNTTVAQLLASKNESFMLDCTSCAETMVGGATKRKEQDEKQRQPAEEDEEEQEQGEEETDEEMIERQIEEEEAGMRWRNVKLIKVHKEIEG